MSKPRTRWYTTVSIVVMFLFSLTVTSAKAQSNPADLDGLPPPLPNNSKITNTMSKR
ncbi:hypothetical protein [Pediococcus acidilactici]|uniref:hypothetical protein n=1 Tax=Pediococcus acidilactici TaxID=1254 RepID=UPI001CC9B9F0|nr:hypothetical protein [Pediococcus acidilactici]